MTNENTLPVPFAAPAGDASRPAEALAQTQALQAPAGVAAVFRNISLREQSLTRLLFKAFTLIIILCLLLVVSLGYNIIQAQRTGTVVLLDKTTGVAVSVNNRDFGSTPAGALVPDKPGELEMKTAAQNFLNSVYRIDPVAKVRLKEAVAGVRMMTPLSAVKYGSWIEENNVWNTQIAQSQEASWTVKPENVKIESRTPIVVSVYGEQKLKKLVGGAVTVETKQIVVPVTLMPDPEGRTERNFFTGFNVDAFGPEKVLNATSEPQESFTAKTQPAQQ